MLDFEIGDRINLPDEGIYGVVSCIEPDEFGEPAALVVQCDNGQWAAIPIDAIECVTVTVH